MIANYRQLEVMVNEVLAPSNILDILSSQERERLATFFYSALTEFTDVHPGESYPDGNAWQNAAKDYLTEQLIQAENSFGIKDLELKLNLPEILKKFYDLEFGA